MKLDILRSKNQERQGSHKRQKLSPRECDTVKYYTCMLYPSPLAYTK